MKTVNIDVTPITTMVAPSNSRLVDQVTFISSAFTSLIKFIGFVNNPIIFWLDLSAGAAGVEPAVTVLETVGLPLTDAPINSQVI